MEKKIKHTNIRYVGLALVFILLGLGLVFLPDKDNTKKLEPSTLLIKLNDNSRLISTDQISDKLITQDPSLILVDVRSPEAFSQGSLPGAINIPFSEILEEESLKLFNRKAYDKVIFANNDVIADQAWVLLAGKLVERTFLLEGGLNQWVNTIINPQKPEAASPTEDFELYTSRIAASRFFVGQSIPFEYMEFDGKVKPASKAKTPKKATSAPVIPPPVEEEEEDEGC